MVTEVTQPLAAEETETALPVGRPTGKSHSTSFSEVVYTHFDWWRALRGGEGLTPELTTAYHDTLSRFEARYGEIVTAYWCSHVESAVALTVKERAIRGTHPIPTFHRESDWATQHSPDIAAELHRCDEIAVRARTVLTGVRRLICMQLVVSSAAHLLSLVDARATHADDAKNAIALAQEREALTRTEKYYQEAANGQAQLVYFGGMALVALLIGIVSAIWLAISWAAPVAALTAGAVGGVVSVIQRINAGKFTLEYDVGRPYAMFLGGLRPLIGGAFALVISFAFTSGLLHLPIAQGESSSHERLALLVVSFLAGFSERWAQDTLAAAMPSSGAKPPKT